MADSYRLQVLKALTSVLEGIDPSSLETGVTSMVGRVFRGRAVFGANDPLTMLSILESPRPSGANYTGDNYARNETWVLLVQGWCKDDKDNPTDPSYSFLDLVEQRLDRVTRRRTSDGGPMYAEHYMLGNLISNFRPGQPVVRPPNADGVSSKAVFYLPVQVGLARIGA